MMTDSRLNTVAQQKLAALKEAHRRETQAMKERHARQIEIMERRFQVKANDKQVNAQRSKNSEYIN
jgi:hypothetical protein